MPALLSHRFFHRFPRLLQLALKSAAAMPLMLPTPAQALYKCPQQGTVLYSDRPCDGQPLDIPASASAIRPRHDEHGNALASDKAEIARLQKSREQRERQDQQIRDLHARGAAARARKCSTLALQLRWREEDLRDAPLPAEQKARVRARRAAEKYRLECE